MINLEEIVRQLVANADAMTALVRPVSAEQGLWRPNTEAWSMKDVMEHVYNEERIDFRKHLKEMLNDPPQPWAKFRREDIIPIKDCHQGLETFLQERRASLAWVRSLPDTDWKVTSQTPFGPGGEMLTLSAGDVLVSWVAHDFLHIRQMNELLYAWTVRQASPFSVQYAGGW
jgi:hypothetical protein